MQVHRCQVRIPGSEVGKGAFHFEIAVTRKILIHLRKLLTGWLILAIGNSSGTLSIFLDKSLRIGYRMVDECENGSPRRAIKYSGE